MPAEPHINGWTQITVWWSDAGGQHSNVFSYKSATQPGPTDVNTIAQNFYNTVGTAFRAVLGNSRNLDYVECRTRWDALNYQGYYYPAQPNPGTVVGDPSPGNVAVAGAWKSGVRGRKFNGRTFWGGLTEALTSGDVVGSSHIVNLNTLMSLIISFTNTGTLPVQFSIASVRGLFLTVVYKLVINAVVDSMRRRLTGRGQ